MTLQATVDDIKSMKVRGAGRIAEAAAAALVEWMDEFKGSDVEAFREHMKRGEKALLGTRPTAVSLRNALTITMRPTGDDIQLSDMRAGVRKAGTEFMKNARVALERIAEFGAHRIPEGATIMTHCNSQAALRPIIKAHKDGKDIKVFATESRPWRQGHVTVKQLAAEGVPVTLIVDSAVRFFMDEMDIVMVGADTIASDGSVINKIGTSQVAMCAREAHVPVIVCAETFKFSPRTARGEVVEIEERDVAEVVDPKEFPGVTIANPVFDTTPPQFITAIITEKGLISPYAAYEIIRQMQGDIL